MALPTLNVTPGAGATVNTLPNAPAMTANSVSVALAIDQAAVPIVAASLPLPNGAAQDGVDATGVTAPAGGAGIRGWLSGIYAKLSGTITVSVASGLPSLQSTSVGYAARSVVTDPASGNGAYVAQFHNADNQSLGTVYGVLTGGVDQLVNGLGNLDRKRAVSGDAMSITGLAAEVPMIFNGTTYDRLRSVSGDAAGSTGILQKAVALWNGASYDRWYGDKTNGAWVNVKALPALPAGSNLIGKIDIDQTTPGATNGVTIVGGALTLTDRSGFIRGAASTATIQASGGAPSHNYAPGDTLTLPAGPGVIAPAVLNVATTQVVSATVAAGGSGGTTGTQTVTGTTGTGTKFQASVAVSGGAITAVNSISVAGSYTSNPTTPAAEPVSGGGLTGAQLNVVLGVGSLTVNSPGVYSTALTNPITPASTSGAGTGATVNITAFVPLTTPVFAANAARQYLMFRNESGSQNLGASLGGTAAFGALGTTSFGPSGDGWSESGNRVPGNAVSLIGGAAFQQFTAWEG
jgi:hypothetical protein